MKLTFVGTRGYIDARTRRHRMHSSLMVAYRGRKVLVDCGEDWLGRLCTLRPRAVFITHGHPDHAGGLKDGAPCPVYATRDAWQGMRNYAVEQREVVEARVAVEIHGMTFEAFAVAHSIRCPAVGYRITAGGVAVFYAPDVAYIPERAAALSGIRHYIGDGATITRPMVRKTGGKLIGHAPVGTQLTWCQKEGVPLRSLPTAARPSWPGDGPEKEKSGNSPGRGASRWRSPMTGCRWC